MFKARLLFYGITMLDRFKGMGWKKPYLIFGMCDETFSINYTANVPEDIDRGWFMFFVTLLNHFYWVSGATIGGLIGSHLTFNTEGLNFVMTAMFVALFMDQWMKEERKYTGLIGIGATSGTSAKRCRASYSACWWSIASRTCRCFQAVTGSLN